jgi:transposase-like protein
MSEVKGQKIKLGDLVRISIKKPEQVIPTTVQGEVTGIRFWRVDEIAIEFDGISGEWFYLDATVELEIV